MGNILTLRRNGLQDGNTYGLIDQLSYTYNGNQLQKVADAVEDPTWQGAFNFMDGADLQAEFEYDENGNLTKDLNKNISRITYNLLNLPKEIMFMDGSYIHYTYDAAGTLLRKGYYVGEELELLDEEPIEIPDIEYTEEESINPMAQLMSNDEPIEEDLEQIEVEEEILYTDVIDYCGNCIYENGTLKMILIEDGYVTFDSNSQPVYHFYLQDHLGNNRVVANASGQVEQVNHYYPYGGLMAESTGGDVQRYKYNGKELDRMLGLDWYDYGARHYDGALTMWGTVDPLCEKYYGISPYVYCGNNPINAFDPDGRVVHPADSNALAILLNTISPEDREFIVINENGNIDYVTMQSHKSESQNYTELMDLVSADIIYNIYVQTEYSYMDNVGNIKSSSLSYSEPDIEFADPDFLSPSGLTTGEAGKYGITLLPGRGKSGVNSPNQDAHIYIHPSLSPLGQAEALSHELYGHGFLYNQYRDRRVSGHDYRKTSRDHNDLLRNNIKRARMETVSYFK